jgi:hypothetical protein
MLVLRLAVGLALGYAALLVLLWRYQERLAFPAPRAAVPDPVAVGIPGGELIALTSSDGTPLAGWFLAPRGPVAGAPVGPAPGLLWFYGNGETIAAIWPVLREFQPPGVALLAVDYPGYGGSGGRAREAALYAAGDAAYEALARRPGVDARRIFVYGRSLGSAVATRTATRHQTAGLILESPFTSAREMSRQHYRLFPRFVLRLGLDNLATIARVRCPVLVFHGTDDLLVPIEMGRRVAAAVPGPVEFVAIEGAGHNDTYDRGGPAYRDRLAAFVRAGAGVGLRSP